jgi:hypothetical protein
MFQNSDILKATKLDLTLRMKVIEDDQAATFCVTVRIPKGSRGFQRKASEYFHVPRLQQVYTVDGLTGSELISLAEHEWVQDISFAEPLQQL